MRNRSRRVVRDRQVGHHRQRNRSTGLRGIRRCNFETLEVRQLLAATPTGFEAKVINDATALIQPIVGPLAPADQLYPEVEAAFQRVSNLNLYSQLDLAAAEKWVVHTSIQIGDEALAFATGALDLEVYEPITDTFFYYVQPGESADTVIDYFDDSQYVDYFYPLVPMSLHTRALADVPDDPFFDQQWHLHNEGQEVGRPDSFPIFGTIGEDINAVAAWELVTGEGVTIAVIDDGIQIDHPDLAPNVDTLLSFDYDALDSDPSPNFQSDFHGTAVAGVAAGAGNNGLGITGVAFDATLAGIRLINRGNLTEDQVADALVHQNQNIDVYNNSYGPPDSSRLAGVDRHFIGGPLTIQALRDSVFFGRDRLGNVHLVAAGNGQGITDSSNFDPFASSRFTIGVGAVDENGVITDYSEGGTNVLVVAPSGTNDTSGGSGIVTTDLVGDSGYNSTGFNDDDPGLGRDFLPDPDYTSRFNGTSAATPVVSGVVGLILEANPNLSYRDVLHILVRSSRQNSPFDPTWLVNWDPLYLDPATDDAGFPFDSAGDLMPISMMDPFFGGSALPVDPIPRLASTMGTIPRLTNGAGYTVHDAQDYAYGHGVVDARLAVDLAQNFAAVAPERSVGLTLCNAGLCPTIGPQIEIQGGSITLPGGLIDPNLDAQTEEFYDLWYNPPMADPDTGEVELPDPVPINGRGLPLPFATGSSLLIEHVEVTVELTEIPAEESSNLRITLVSPEGTHSDMINYVRSPRTRDPWVRDDVSDQNPFMYTFTTSRHWGERTDTDLVDADGFPIPWKLEFTNWTDSEMELESLRVDFYGTVVSQGAGRIQGVVGADVNADGEYNYTGLLLDGAIATDADLADPADKVFAPDFATEPRAAEVLVYVDLDRDGALGEFEPRFETGADGNYYFDLPPGQYIVRAFAPDGSDLTVGQDGLSVTLDADVPRVRDANFLVQPQPITFRGRVTADFDGDGEVDAGLEPGAEGFVVYVDLDKDGTLDYIDNNFNLRFDVDDNPNDPFGPDEPTEPIAIIGLEGSYSITMGPEVPGFIGSGRYSINLHELPRWELTFPDLPRYVLFAQPGSDNPDLDFLVDPEDSTIFGTVSLDILDPIGVHNNDPTNPDHVDEFGKLIERGLGGFEIFLDLNNDGLYSFNEPRTTTSDTGFYAFFNRTRGDYYIRLVQTPGWKQTSPPDPGPPDDPNVVDDEFIHLAAGSLARVDFLVNDIDTVDFGDAPYDPPADGPATHLILLDFQLGDTVNGGQAAPGESTDNDGVSFGEGNDTNTVMAGTDHVITVTASQQGGYLQGWLDADQSGTWEEGEERIITNALLSMGENAIPITIPVTAEGGMTYARFRYGPFGINSPGGAADRGEVEDYLIFVMPAPMLPQDFNNDGSVDRGDFAVFQQNAGTTEGATQSDGDSDGDGDVDGRDLLDLLLAAGTTIDQQQEPPRAQAALTGSSMDGSITGAAAFADSSRLSDRLTAARLAANAIASPLDKAFADLDAVSVNPKYHDSSLQSAGNAFVSGKLDHSLLSVLAESHAALV